MHCTSQYPFERHRGKLNACALDLGEPKKNEYTMQFAGILEQVSCKSFLKFQPMQVGIISLGALFCESSVNTRSP